LLLGFLLLRYLLKSGILVVGLLPMPRKGESNDEGSIGWHLLDVVESARTGSDGSDVRGRARSMVREVDERAAMVLRARGGGQLGVDAVGDERFVKLLRILRWTSARIGRLDLPVLRLARALAVRWEGWKLATKFYKIQQLEIQIR
jgi:hypothetical protein